MSRVSKVSNFVKKSSHGSEMFDLKSEREKKPSSRNPLKDLNSINSSNSSTSSLPIEAPRGCLSFVLSNSSSKSPLYRYKNLPQTPKSAPNPGHSQFRSKPVVKQRPRGGGAISGNVEKPKRSSCLYQWQNNKKCCFRASRHPNPAPDLEGHRSGATELIPGVCLKEEALKDKKRVNTSEYSDSRLLRAVVDLKEEGTPVNKLAQGSGLDSTPGKFIDEENTRTANRTPPVQASISPEIQYESSVVSTPTCFGAGHVLSGVTDKRKCKPRGFLTVREEPVLCKDGALDGIGHSDVAGHLDISRVSLVPVPTEASVQWLFPSCVEEGEDYKPSSIKSSPESGSLLGTSSPSPSLSRHGFSSDACSISNSENTATATTGYGREKRNHLVSPIEFPKYGNFVGPMSTVSQKRHSSDHANGCSSSSTPVPSSTTSNHKDGLSQEVKEYRYDRGRKSSPFSWDSLGSGNAMCTPESDSSPDVIRFGLSWMDGDNHQEHQPELDSMVDILHNTHLSPQSQISMWGVSDVPSLPALSAHFLHPVTPLNSVDWSQIQKPLNDLTADHSCSSFENASQSQMRISWRDGLVSRVFEMEESNCSCGFSYEEQEAAVNCYDNDQMKSDLNHEVSEPSRENLPLIDCLKPLESSYEENAINREDKVKILPERSSACAESISTDGGGLITSNDSDWFCFKNKLFEV